MTLVIGNASVVCLTGERLLWVWSCCSKSRRRSPVRPVDDVGARYLAASSAALVVDSNALFNSLTRPNDGRSVLLFDWLSALSICCCSNLARRSSMMDDDDDDRLGGVGRLSSVRVVFGYFVALSRDRAD